MTSPIARLHWLSSLNRHPGELCASALKVAMFVAWQRDGRLMHSLESISAEIGISYNSADKGVKQLLAAGFLERTAAPRQHAPATYRMVIDAATATKAKTTAAAPSASPADQPMPYLDRLRNAGAVMRARGQDLSGEWKALPAALGITEDDVVARVKEAPSPKFPSRIRDAVTTGDGLVSEDRTPSIEEAMAALGPAQEVADVG